MFVLEGNSDRQLDIRTRLDVRLRVSGKRVFVSRSPVQKWVSH